jgi:hypothetical protein
VCNGRLLGFLLQDVKKTMQRRNAPVQRTQHLGPDRAVQTRDGDVVDAEPASDASSARSIQRAGNASRKRVLRSRCIIITPNPKLADYPHDLVSISSESLTGMPNVFQL